MTKAQAAQAMWALGDYDRIGALIAEQGRAVVAAAELGPGMRVLDVGAGSGYASLPAAATGADVVATDVTPELLEIGKRHARERGLTLRWQVADAEELPFADGEFDAVISCIGAMFAPDQPAAARELLRVCRAGGTVTMANWTPDGAAGRFFRLLSRYHPAAGDGPPPVAWGDPEHVTALLHGAEVCVEPRRVPVGFSGPPDALAAHYLRYFPPLVATVGELDAARTAQLRRELVEFFAGLEAGPAGYGYEYLLVTARVPESLRPEPARPPAATR
ncbi:MAG TPA: class I SAM-dependent methyltransferase [Pseudonocardia sp.]|nr:class I SAM-dependent methyltransferase [Pseudonocardia sp.]